MNKSKKGFTLIELIAVVAIIAILASITVPMVISYVHKSRQVAIKTEAKTIYTTAEQAYNDGILVPTKENTDINPENPNGKPEFDFMKLSYVMKKLNDNDLITIKVKEKDKLLYRVGELGWLKHIINAKTEEIKVDPDGSFGGFIDE